MILPQNYGWFRWQFFRVHFQFVMANEVPHAYEFFMIVCGAVPLHERFTHPEAALATATRDAAVREKAWKTIDPDPISAGVAAEMGGLEPSARHRG
jgi:hypothetical protein